jgi:hypothetical protein
MATMLAAEVGLSRAGGANEIFHTLKMRARFRFLGDHLFDDLSQ